MHVVEIGGYGPGQDYRIDRQFEFGERLRQLGLVGLAQGEEELLVLMFDDQLDEGGERPVGERDLAFAVDDVLLQVEGYGLGLADVFHGFRNGDARLLADVEETVHSGSRREDDGRMRKDFDPLCAELLQRDADNADKGLVGDLYLILLGQLVERGFSMIAGLGCETNTLLLSIAEMFSL